MFGCVGTKAQSLDQFYQWKNEAKALIILHSQSHRDCTLNNLVDKIDSVDIILSPVNNPNQSMWVFPDDNIMSHFIFVNSKAKWNRQKAIRNFIHETLHLKGMCCKDSSRSIQPICYLFNQSIYESVEINEALDKHLEKELRIFK
jgi:hypothetical protein